MEKQQYQKAEEWRDFLQSYFHRQLQQKKTFVNEQRDFVLTKKNELGTAPDFATQDKNKQSIFSYLKTFFAERPGDVSLKNKHPDFFGSTKTILAGLPEIIVKEQAAERFKILKTDKFTVKFLKLFKIPAFHLSRLPFHVTNIFRREKKPLQYWNHEIKCQKLFKKHLIIDFYRQWNELDSLIEKEFLEALEALKNFEKQLNLTSPETSEIEIAYFDPDYEKDIVLLINNWYEAAIANLERDFELCGTIEFRDKKLAEEKQDREAYKAINRWQKTHHQWENTAHALFEDWRSELELSALQAFIQAGTFALTANIKSWQDNIEHAYLKEIDQFLTEAQANFELDPEEDSDVLRKKISQVNYKTKKQLDQALLQKLQDALSKNSLLNQLDRLEHQINERIDQLANQYVVTKSNRFNQPLSDSDLQTISNFELISFEIEPKLNDKLESLKSVIFQKMGDLLIIVDDIDEMVSYMLSTASNALDQEKNEIEALKIITDGFQRAYNKSSESHELLAEIISSSQEHLQAISISLLADLQELKENENVSALRIRINKAKAFQKSEAYTQKVTDEARKLFKKVEIAVTDLYKKASDIVDQLKKRFLSATISHEPQRDVSDFLAESNNIINKLPIIYKRLYAIEPLNDMVLFEGREEEVQKLATAYNAWENGKYASVLLTGEKWSGTTSLINFGVKKLKTSYTPLRLTFNGNNPEPVALYGHLSRLLGVKEVMSSASIVEYLNEGSKRIIILEDLQNIFLRVLHGQKALIALIEIISATQKNVFWITSMSVYTFNYLEGSLKISAFFSYHIPLSPLKPESISQLIIKRNRISGFKIEFEASEKDLKDKKFRRLNANDQQAYLKERFFKELNAFAKSNISMALMYWLLSTKEVSGQSIRIRNFKKPDLSFLASLQSDRIFVLLALIMHDGLNETQVAAILSLDLQKVKFLLLEMTEDGILLNQDGFFMVNTIVYRTAVQLLKSKNMLISKE